MAAFKRVARRGPRLGRPPLGRGALVRAARLALLGAWLLSAAGQAQERVQIALPGCARQAWSVAELLSSLRAELGPTYAVEAVSDTTRAQLEVRCAGADVVQLRVHPTPDAPEAARAVGLRDVPRRLHARTLALLLAESLRSRANRSSQPRAIPGSSLSDGTPADRASNSERAGGAAAAPAARAVAAPGPGVAPAAGAEPVASFSGSAASTTREPGAQIPGQRSTESQRSDARDSSSVSEGDQIRGSQIRGPQTESARVEAQVVSGASQPEAAEAERAGDPLKLALEPALRWFLSHGDWLWGGALTLRYRDFDLGIEGLGGGRSSTFGQAYYGLGQALVRYGVWRLQLAASGLHFGLGARAAAGARFAWATPLIGASASRVVSLGWEFGADAEFGYRISPDWDLRLRASGGYGRGLELKSQTVGREPEYLASLSGWFVSASLAIALRIAEL